MPDVQLLCLSKEKFDRLVESNTLNEDCMVKLKEIAEQRAKENAVLVNRNDVTKGETKLTERLAGKLTMKDFAGKAEIFHPSDKRNESVRVYFNKYRDYVYVGIGSKTPKLGSSPLEFKQSKIIDEEVFNEQQMKRYLVVTMERLKV